MPQRSTARSRRTAPAPAAALAVAAALALAAAGCDSPEPTNTRADTAPSPSASAPTLDKCLFGSWKVTRATSTEIVDDDVVEFTNDGGAAWRFNPDGTGEFDFGGGTTYVNVHEGARVTYVYKGKVTFAFSIQPVGQQLVLDDVRPDAESGAVVSVGGKSVWVQTRFGPDSVTYRCSDNSLELIDEVKTMELRRA